jgi:ketosteroid isomerase-like protein
VIFVTLVAKPVSVLFVAPVFVASVAAQAQAPLPIALQSMVDTEREFATHALMVGWKQAFLDYFDPGALGFDGGVGLAREQIRANPDPPKDLQLRWEPRYGDVAASGELGYLTGPVRSILPSRNSGRPRHSNYASVWKRQRDGTFKVVMDVGVPTPGPVPFAEGFTRAPSANRFNGDYDANTPTLDGADRVLNSLLRSSQSSAYRGRLAEGARLHRPNAMPAVGERAILARLSSQPPMATSDARYAEAAQSGDLGYTWGNYSFAARPNAKAEQGFYVRVWVRARDAQWKVALDVLQPQ